MGLRARPSMELRGFVRYVTEKRAGKAADAKPPRPPALELTSAGKGASSSSARQTRGTIKQEEKSPESHDRLVGALSNIMARLDGVDAEISALKKENKSEDGEASDAGSLSVVGGTRPCPTV